MQKDRDIPVSGKQLKGILAIPENPIGMILFSHGSGSGRFSPRNQFVAEVLQKAHFATLLVDLLTEEEDEIYENRFDIDLLTQRLIEITHWLISQEATKKLNIGLFGASTGAAAALKCSAKDKSIIKAVVSRGGRPDLAMPVLSHVNSPVLLLVGGDDTDVIVLNKQAYAVLTGVKKLEIIPGATHLFEEPGALESVAELARDWFLRYLS